MRDAGKFSDPAGNGGNEKELIAAGGHPRLCVDPDSRLAAQPPWLGRHPWQPRRLLLTDGPHRGNSRSSTSKFERGVATADRKKKAFT